MIKQILCNPCPPAPPAAKPFPKLMRNGTTGTIGFFMSGHNGVVLAAGSARTASSAGTVLNSITAFYDYNEPLTIQNV